MDIAEIFQDDVPVALIIMFITVAASIAALFFPSFMMENIQHPFSIARGRRLHTLVTGNLIHADIPHLLFNMFSYYFFAFSLQEVVGWVNFLLIYLGSMLIANIPSLIQHRNDEHYMTLGASGAVSGIVFSTIMFAPMTKFYILLVPVGIPAAIYGLLFLGFSYYAARKQNDNINHDAHLWGALAGIVLTIIVRPDSINIFLQGVRQGIGL